MREWKDEWSEPPDDAAPTAPDDPEPFVRLIEADPDGVSLWLEPSDQQMKDGLCIGAGATLGEAIADARESLACAARQLDRIESDAPTRRLAAVSADVEEVEIQLDEEAP